MYFLFFRDEISVATVNELVQRLQDNPGPVSLWFSTNGGTSSAMEFLMTYLNSRAEEITVTLTDKIYSAGTQILTDFKGVKNQTLFCFMQLIERPTTLERTLTLLTSKSFRSKTGHTTLGVLRSLNKETCLQINRSRTF